MMAGIIVDSRIDFSPGSLRQVKAIIQKLLSFLDNYLFIP
jgi:hypothetical protein